MKISSIDKSLLKRYNKTRLTKSKQKICYAPFSSLLFIQSGHVMPCHYNRGTILGKIPENTIKEIWFGEKINLLRNFLNKNDLNYGCDSCFKNLAISNFYNTGARKYDNLNLIKDYPIMLDFQISNTCNLECIMCSGEYSSAIRTNRESKEQYSNPYTDEFISQLDEFIPHLKFAKFTGGEPFLIKQYHQIWNKIEAINKNLNISVSTNGSILNDKIKQILNQLNFSFTISVDSITEENYSKIRKNSKLPETLKNISYFIDYSEATKNSLIIKFVVIQQNWDELPEFFDHWNNKNIRLLPKMVWFPPHASLRDLPSDKLESIIKHLDNKKFANKTKLQKENTNLYYGVLEQIKEWHRENLNKNKTDKSSEEIIIEITRNIKDYIDQKEFISYTEKEKKIKKYKLMILEMANSVQDKHDKQNALLKFGELPIDIIVAEMEREHLEKLTERFKQSCYF